jgi:peptidoglycan/xylan/chitin deacetylase (PgdA/CDA1 family)
MPATFYVVSGAVDAPGYLTREQLRTIAAQGQEIGGHTVTHPHLRSTGSPDEVRRQICGDRTTLANWGFRVTSFAYLRRA